MKKTLTIIAFLSFLISHGQFKEGIIYDKTGNKRKGLIKIRAFGGIKFKLNQDSNEINYDEKNISGYDVKDNGMTKMYRYKKVEKGYLKPMKLEISGKINLYSIFSSNAGVAGPMGLPVASGKTYFVEKDGTTLKLGTKIKSKKLYLFEDCPVLMKRINDKELKKAEITKIIIFYNKECN